MDKKETKVEDDFLAGLNVEETQLGVDSGELFPEDTVTTEGGKQTVKEDEVPFHKNEKAQRYIEKEINRRLKDFKPSAEQTFKEDVSQGEPKFISSLEKIIGNDTPEKVKALADLKEDWTGMTKQAKAEALKSVLEAQQEAEKKEQAEIAEAVDELEEGREEIESSIGKELTERQWDAYKEFLSDIEPKGGYEQYPNFVKTFAHFKSLNSKSNANAKNLAARGMDRATTSTTEAPVKGGSWKDFEAVKEKLLAS